VKEERGKLGRRGGSEEGEGEVRKEKGK